MIEENSYEYVGTEIKKTGDSEELIIYIDKDGGIGLDDCEKISRLIEPSIDACDPIEDSYFLCVSSPGLDRALKTTRDYERSVGKNVDIKLYKQTDGLKEFTGKLIRSDEKCFTVLIKDEEKQFDFSDTAIVRMHVDI